MDYAILLQAEQHCSLSHTLALWRLMALERAKIKSRNKQVRFEVIFFILMVLIFDLCNFRHFFWNFSLIAFVRLRIKRTTATSFKVWLVFLCALHEMYTLTLPQGHQSVVLILKVWLVVFKLVRPTLKQTFFGNFFFRSLLSNYPTFSRKNLAQEKRPTWIASCEKSIWTYFCRSYCRLFF